MPLSPPSADAYYLTNAEAAHFLRLAPRTLDRYRYEGGGPRFYKFGRKVVYARKDLEIWSAKRGHATAEMPAAPTQGIVP